MSHKRSTALEQSVKTSHTIEINTFPAGDYKAARNSLKKNNIKHIHKTKNTKKINNRSTDLKWSGKNTGGFKHI